jgi:hypothetical protein
LFLQLSFSESIYFPQCIVHLRPLAKLLQAVASLALPVGIFLFGAGHILWLSFQPQVLKINQDDVGSAGTQES